MDKEPDETNETFEMGRLWPAPALPTCDHPSSPETEPGRLVLCGAPAIEAIERLRSAQGDEQRLDKGRGDGG